MPFKEGSFPEEKPAEEQPKKEPKITRRGFLKAALGAAAVAGGALVAHEFLKEKPSEEKKKSAKKEESKKEEEVFPKFEFELTPEERNVIVNSGVAENVLYRLHGFQGQTNHNFEAEAEHCRFFMKSESARGFSIGVIAPGNRRGDMPAYYPYAMLSINQARWEGIDRIIRGRGLPTR